MTRGRWLLCGLMVLLLAGCGEDNMAALQEGDMAPEFALTADDGRTVRLADYRDSRAVVLYFYPKDQTPGCTREACGFRDALAEFARRGVAVLGISVDSVESHRAFKQKENLNFTLLADTGKEVTRRYGVLGGLGLASRVTFLIGQDGRISKIFRDFDPAANAQQVLASLPPVAE